MKIFSFLTIFYHNRTYNIYGKTLIICYCNYIVIKVFKKLFKSYTKIMLNFCPKFKIVIMCLLLLALARNIITLSLNVKFSSKAKLPIPISQNKHLVINEPFLAYNFIQRVHYLHKSHIFSTSCFPDRSSYAFLIPNIY